MRKRNLHILNESRDVRMVTQKVKVGRSDFAVISPLTVEGWEFSDKLRESFNYFHREGIRNFLLNFEEVPFVSSHHINALVYIYKKINGEGVLVLSDVDEQAEHAMHICGFLSLPNVQLIDKRVPAD